MATCSRLISLDAINKISITDSLIQPAFLKYLGVVVNSALAMDKHINSICRSVNYHICTLCHVRSATSAAVANNIACAIVGAQLDYGNSLLRGTSKTNIITLQCLLNSTA